MPNLHHSRSTLVSFANVLIEIPDNWQDISDTLPSGTPPTLAAQGGVGSLQFSVALYKSGPIPDIDSKALEQLLYHFEDAKGFERTMSASVWQTSFVFGTSCDYSFEDAFIRVWYCSDGANVAFITFYTDPLISEILKSEVDVADLIARSVRFKSNPRTPVSQL